MYDVVPASNGDPGDVQTLRTPLAGALAWTVDDWHLPFRAQAQYAFAPHAVLALGGYHDPAVGALAGVYVAKLAPDGAAAAAATTTTLPSPVAFGAAIDYLSAIGMDAIRKEHHEQTTTWINPQRRACDCHQRL